MIGRKVAQLVKKKKRGPTGGLVDGKGDQNGGTLGGKYGSVGQKCALLEQVVAQLVETWLSCCGKRETLEGMQVKDTNQLRGSNRNFAPWHGSITDYFILAAQRSVLFLT